MNRPVELLYFEWDGVSSSKYKLYITNEDGISLPTTPVFRDSVVTPEFQNVGYYAGTTFESTPITLPLAAIDVSLLEIKEIQDWLSVDKVSSLSIDTNPDFYYNCKVSNISDSIWRPYYNPETEGYILEFTIQFKTVGDYAKMSKQLFKFNLDSDYYDKVEEEPYNAEYKEWIDPYYGLPVMVYDGKANRENNEPEVPGYKTKTRVAKIINVMNDALYVDSLIEGVTNTNVYLDGKSSYLYDFRKLEKYNENPDLGGRPSWKPVSLSILGNYGFVLDKSTNQLVELTVENFVDKTIEYDIKYNVNYSVAITEDDINNNGSYKIKPSHKISYRVVLNYYTVMEGDGKVRYFVNYKFNPAELGQFIIDNCASDNKYLRFIKQKDLIPMILNGTSGNLGLNNGIGTFEISRQMFNEITNFREVTVQEGEFIFVSFVEFKTITSLSGSEDSRDFSMPTIKPLKGFGDNRESIYNKLIDNKQTWFEERMWKKFSLNNETPSLVSAKSTINIWDYRYNQNTSLATNSIAAGSLSTTGTDFVQSQELFNNYIAGLINGILPEHLLVSVPLVDMPQHFQINGEADAYCNKFKKLTNEEISEAKKEGFFITNLGHSYPTLFIRILKNRVGYGIDESFNNSNIVSFLQKENLVFYYRVLNKTVIALPDNLQDLLEYADKKASVIGETVITGDSASPSLSSPCFFKDSNEDGKFKLPLAQSMIEIATRLRSR